ncbi:MAG: hypothetical protein IKW67_01845 [Alphaproteobacteria bacterium]|nr:hypothetical protein [Alphaproteobacteria bacterium]
MFNILKFLLTIIFIANCTVAIAEEDSFDFENFAVVDSEDVDITTESVELNSDAERADVAAFDIADIMLGMQFDDVQTLFFKAKGLYAPRKKNSIIYTIHNDWKYNLDYECRQQGIVIPTELDKCIKSLARNRGLLYASELHLIRENTGETVDVYFTSNATDNRVWKIVYNNDVDEIEGDAEKFAKQRENKILAFWQAVLDKYGAPNSGTDKWISSTNAYDPMMTAYYGRLELVEMGRNAADLAKNNQQAREHFKAKPYAF